jgi:VIT1/CCC1 family predicted Fe2+/Mn2+ transporter
MPQLQTRKVVCRRVLRYIFSGSLQGLAGQTPAMPLVAAICCSAFGLFTVGVLVTLLTGRKVVFCGAHQLCFAPFAADVTFDLGRLIGTAVGG